MNKEHCASYKHMLDYMRSSLSALVKKYGQRIAEDSPAKDALGFKETYTLRVLDIDMPIRWQDEFLIGVQVHVYDDHEVIEIWTYPQPIKTGNHRTYLHNLDEERQQTFIQQIIGAYALIGMPVNYP